LGLIQNLDLFLHHTNKNNLQLNRLLLDLIHPPINISDLMGVMLKFVLLSLLRLAQTLHHHLNLQTETKKKKILRRGRKRRARRQSMNKMQVLWGIAEKSDLRKREEEYYS